MIIIEMVDERYKNVNKYQFTIKDDNSFVIKYYNTFVSYLSLITDLIVVSYKR